MPTTRFHHEKPKPTAPDAADRFIAQVEGRELGPHTEAGPRQKKSSGSLKSKARLRKEIESAMRTFDGPFTKITPEMIHANVLWNMAKNIKRNRSISAVRPAASRV